jgi:hypothetical protein
MVTGDLVSGGKRPVQRSQDWRPDNSWIFQNKTATEVFPKWRNSNGIIFKYQ